jgi:hypothetical protein
VSLVREVADRLVKQHQAAHASPSLRQLDRHQL